MRPARSTLLSWLGGFLALTALGVWSFLSPLSSLVWHFKSTDLKPYTGELLMTLKGHSGAVNSAAFSPDNQHIITGSSDATARVWSANNGELLLTLKGHSGAVTSAAFSPKKKLPPNKKHRVIMDNLSGGIITASGDYVRLWSSEGSLLAMLIQNHSDTFNSAAFAPDDDRFIVTTSDDGAARVWSSDGSLLITLTQDHSDSVNSAAFSRDDEHIVTANGDGTVRVYRLNLNLI
ncbi:MAG: hypothetical protein JO051_17095 [Acidobacteriaceae bacterium]|nr:hypothetical protein [Acidobacteriaceae bacterium]